MFNAVTDGLSAILRRTHPQLPCLGLLFFWPGTKRMQKRLAAIAFHGLLIGLNAAEQTGAGAQTCLECHEKLSSKSTASWRESKHATHGVGCADCHGTEHSAIFLRRGQVSAAVCGRCHAEQHKEFDRSLHASAMDSMEADPKFKRLSPAVRELSCTGCHQIGTRFADGSRGKCNSCHSSHSFSVMEARRPEACAQCHTGPDHAQMEMWQASKHGQLFSSEQTRPHAPGCITCHMPKGSHDTGFGLTLGHVGNGAVIDGAKPPVKMKAISKETARQQRQAMIQTCVPCHSSRFATESLAKADMVKREADGLLQEAVTIIDQLHKSGLLRRGTNVISPSDDLGLGFNRVSDGLSPVEQRFFDMFKFHHANTFKGAYHHSPNHLHNEGFLRMKQDLTFLNNEAARLRAEALQTKKKESP
jgi:hypothetical protein